MIVTKEMVTEVFDAGGYTINERFEETGFIYFPLAEAHLTGKRGRDWPDQGRVFWQVEKHKYPDTPDGKMEATLDRQFGKCLDEINVCSSWGRATDEQTAQILKVVQLYTLYSRQQRPDYHWSVADRAERALAAEAVGA
jgi:hypothetical protein